MFESVGKDENCGLPIRIVVIETSFTGLKRRRKHVGELCTAAVFI